ncbi:MAG: glycosyltransferase family 4 protein [Aigarchaeota archaeon]|nr:glycosyltransferase family 4 protein [Aigarchaeota archaeon]MDW7986875.1 glycosyltransferase family 4 protein [Nitrososphaerota archaeon]
MKIIYLTNLFSNSCGSEYVFWIYAKYMVLEGHEVVVVCYRAEEEAIKNAENLVHDEKLHIYQLRPNIIHRGVLFTDIHSNFSYISEGLSILKELCKNHDITIIHSNTYIPVLLGFMISKFFRKPHFLTLHDVASIEGTRFIYRWFREDNAAFAAGAKSIFAKAYEQFILSLPYNGIIVPSLTTLEDLRQLRFSKKNIFVLPNAIDPSLYDQEHVSNITYEPIILYIGRLVWYKNLDVLFLAFKQVSKTYSNAKLIIIGDGPSKTRYEQLAIRLGLKNRIEFLGKVPGRIRDYWLSRATAIVNPSLYEGFGLTILEAWLFKKPIIVSNIKPLSDIIKDGGGFTFPPNDPRTLAEKLILLLSDKYTSQEVGERGYRKFEAYYRPDKVTSTLSKIYRSFLEQETSS